MSYEGYKIKDFSFKGIILKGIKCCNSKSIAGSIKIVKYCNYCDYYYYIYIGGLYNILFPFYLLL